MKAHEAEKYIAAARGIPAPGTGPQTCRECRQHNDRSLIGYDTCIDCA